MVEDLKPKRRRNGQGEVSPRRPQHKSEETNTDAGAAANHTQPPDGRVSVGGHRCSGATRGRCKFGSLLQSPHFFLCCCCLIFERVCLPLSMYRESGILPHRWETTTTSRRQKYSTTYACFRMETSTTVVSLCKGSEAMVPQTSASSAARAMARTRKQTAAGMVAKILVCLATIDVQMIAVCHCLSGNDSTFVWGSIFRYEGEWKSGLRHGKGTQVCMFVMWRSDRF